MESTGPKHGDSRRALPSSLPGVEERIRLLSHQGVSERVMPLTGAVVPQCSFLTSWSRSGRPRIPGEPLYRSPSLSRRSSLNILPCGRALSSTSPNELVAAFGCLSYVPSCSLLFTRAVGCHPTVYSVGTRHGGIRSANLESFAIAGTPFPPHIALPCPIWPTYCTTMEHQRLVSCVTR